jgi:hypothetical protein
MSPWSNRMAQRKDPPGVGRLQVKITAAEVAAVEAELAALR